MQKYIRKYSYYKAFVNIHGWKYIFANVSNILETERNERKTERKNFRSKNIARDKLLIPQHVKPVYNSPKMNCNLFWYLFSFSIVAWLDHIFSVVAGTGLNYIFNSSLSLSMHLIFLAFQDNTICVIINYYLWKIYKNMLIYYKFC